MRVQQKYSLAIENVVAFNQRSVPVGANAMPQNT
jgi:hypothetical protein